MQDTGKRYFQDVRKEMWAAIVFSCGINLLVLTLPIYSLQLFDRVMTSASLDTLFALLAIALFLITSQALLEHIRTMLLQRSALKLDKSLSGKLLSRSITHSSKANRIEKQSLQDLSALRNFLVSPSTSSILDLPWTPFFLILLFFFHPYIGLVALSGVILFSVLAFLMMLGGKELTELNRETSSRLSMELNDFLRNAPTLKAMGMSDDIGNTWSEKNEKVLALQWRVNFRTGILLAISRYARTLLQVLILTVGVYLALYQQIGIGAVIASSILIGRVLSPFEQAVSGWKTWYGTYKAWRRLNLEEQQESTIEKTLQPKPKGDIHFNNVTLKLPHQAMPVLQAVNFKLGAGNALAIMGNSGSGKSILASMIMGIHPASMGEVLIDGACIKKWDQKQFGQYIGYLPQHVGLLAGTVKQNICRFSKSDDNKVIDAARLACIHELIMTLPDGYETYIGEGGSLLSGGQKQRIALARAIYSKPQVLVLDEPNSNLDPEGENCASYCIAIL